MFVSTFLSSIGEELSDRVKTFLTVPLDKTKEVVPISVIADLATHGRRTRNFVSTCMVVPDGPQLIHSIPLCSKPVASDGHPGQNMALSIQETLSNYGVVADQIVSTTFDGAMVHEKVGEWLEKAYGLDPEAVHHNYDAMHKVGRVEANTIKEDRFSFVDKTRMTVQDVIVFIGQGNNLAMFLEVCKEVEAFPFSLSGFCETRMSNYAEKVLLRFIKNFPTIMHVLQAIMEKHASATSGRNKEIHDKAGSLITGSPTKPLLSTSQV